MKRYTATTTVGNVTAGQVNTLFQPMDILPMATCGVVLCHGAGAPYNFIENTRLGSVTIPAALATADWCMPSISAEMSGDTFGNDTAMTAVTNAMNYLTAQTAVNPSKVHLFGESMGVAVALRWAYLNPTKVASIVGILPAVNLVSLYNSNAGGLRAPIGTAWGVTYPTALPSGADLMAQAPSLSGIPIRFYIAGSDAIISASDVNAHAALSGAEVIGPVGSSGHSEASVLNMSNYNQTNWSDTIEWMSMHG